jgi:hypothetical protein
MRTALAVGESGGWGGRRFAGGGALATGLAGSGAFAGGVSLPHAKRAKGVSARANDAARIANDLIMGNLQSTALRLETQRLETD